MKKIQYVCTLLFGVMVFLFFGGAYPHHLHYQEQYQLFLFDHTYVWEIVRRPGGVADLLGRFCTQFFLFAWMGAAIIALLLSLVQLLTLRLFNGQSLKFKAQSSWLSQAAKPSAKFKVESFYGLSFVPAFLLWIFLLDENALLGGVWAVLLTLLAVWGYTLLPKGWTQRIVILVSLPVLYWLVGPDWNGSHYYRYPKVFPALLYAAWLSAIVLPLIVRVCQKWVSASTDGKHFTSHSSLFTFHLSLITFALVAIIMGIFVWKNANFKAEKVMQYDFMARHQQWNRILEAINIEKPNNQIGVTVQNLALAMHGQLVNHIFDYNQNGIAGLLPAVQSDATSPLPTAEVHYQLGMIAVAQRTVFEAQEAILDFQKSGRCYKRLAQTNLILGSYEVARKYLMALQKTLFYRDWANETLPLVGNEEAIDKHPEYGRLRQMVCNEDYYFSDQVTPEMLETLYESNKDNLLALEYLKAYYVLTGDRENYGKILLQTSAKQ